MKGEVPLYYKLWGGIGRKGFPKDTESRILEYEQTRVGWCVHLPRPMYDTNNARINVNLLAFRGIFKGRGWEDLGGPVGHQLPSSYLLQSQCIFTITYTFEVPRKGGRSEFIPKSLSWKTICLHHKYCKLVFAASVSCIR